MRFTLFYVFIFVYDKSKQFQKEDFVLRNEKLTAERDSIINRKQKRTPNSPNLKLRIYIPMNDLTNKKIPMKIPKIR